MAVPTLIQHVGSTTSDNNGALGNGFQCNLPNPTLAGNCLIFEIAYPYSATRTVAIVDSTGDTWPAPALVQGTASTGNMRSAVYVLPNASAGIHYLTTNLDTTIKGYDYELSEFNNIATVSPVDGTIGANSVAGSSANAGSFTPSTNNDANGGHLILQYAVSNDPIGTLAANRASAMTPTNSAKLLSADNTCTIPSASAYFVQAVNGAVNPGFAITQPSGTNFVVSAIALKAASAGQAPAAGVRIIRVLHFSIDPGATAVTPLFPCDGNLRVLTMAAGSDLNPVSSVTDSDGNTYNARTVVAGASQVFDFFNTAANNALGLTINTNANQYSGHLWDVTGADPNPFMNISSIYTQAPASGTVCNDLPDHTPNANVSGLTLWQSGFGTAGPVSIISGFFGAGSPAGAIPDIIYYTAMTDADTFDNADPFGHVYFSSNAAQRWNPTINSAAWNSTAFGSAVSYKSAPVSNPASPALGIIGMASSEW